MPKIGASMANVSTEFVPVEPDVYTCNITDCKMETKDGRTRVMVENTVVFGEETGTDAEKRKINDFIHLHLKTGDWNEIGLAQLKRYFEAALDTSDWDEERWDEADTDELIGNQVMLAVTISEYEKEMPNGEKVTKKRNEIDRVLPV